MSQVNVDKAMVRMRGPYRALEAEDRLQLDQLRRRPPLERRRGVSLPGQVPEK